MECSTNRELLPHRCALFCHEEIFLSILVFKCSLALGLLHWPWVNLMNDLVQLLTYCYEVNILSVTGGQRLENIRKCQYNLMVSCKTAVTQFGHLAIAVSPRLEVEIGGHASLDGCNFQRKRPGPHGVPHSATLCAQTTMRLMIMIYNAGNLRK